MPLISGARYLQGGLPLGGALPSGGRYYRGDRYFRDLTGGQKNKRYFRVAVIFGGTYRYFRNSTVSKR